VDSLREDIKGMVMIQRPATFDAAGALALVQEEAMYSGKRKESKRFDYSAGSRFVPKPAFPLPPPPKLDKPLGSTVVDDRRNSEAVRTTSTDDKLKALKQYRRARGLCNRCAEKWVYGHKCTATVQLHAIYEFWDLLPSGIDEAGGGESLPDDSSGSQLCLLLSEAAYASVEF
jgi:hypothetical protein